LSYPLRPVLKVHEAK